MQIYDFFQNFLIRDAQSRADRADVRSHGNEVTVQMLQDQIDHLSLAVYAMAELLENVGFTNDMLLAKIKEIDLRDGKLDGKLSQQRTCLSCNRQIAGRHLKCLYCGEVVNIKLDLKK